MARRLLNIASIVCLVLCVALMGMWARSYWWSDAMSGMCGRWFIYIGTYAGDFGVDAIVPTMNAPDRWRAFSHPIVQGVVQGSATPFALAKAGILGIRWNKSANGCEITVRLPLLLLLSGISAAVLWRRPQYHFSLRTLLITTTVLAAVLAIVGFAVRYLTAR